MHTLGRNFSVPERYFVERSYRPYTVAYKTAHYWQWMVKLVSMSCYF